MRGLGDEDKDAAPTGEVETTQDSNPYRYPGLPNVTIWDLPGIGTEKFKPEEYLKQVNFQRYDFFIILTANRFFHHHSQLAKEIQKMGKKFYYVRSKVDADLYAAETRRPKTYSEKEILNKIREDCFTNLEKVNEGKSEAPPKVFLLSSWKLSKYDFQLLMQTLEEELDAHKRQVFILALPNISEQILEKKRAELENQIWKVALVSGAISSFTGIAVSLVVDITRLVITMKNYCKAFGLDQKALCRLAQQVGKPVEDLKSEIKVVPMVKSINKEYVISLLGKCACAPVMVSELVLNRIPIIGSLLSGGVSFVTTRNMLKRFLNEAAQDAQRVLNKALSPEQKSEEQK
ncbi:hypothetical protein Y1Q_0022071 [Alligator mississippiensis]|uniref:IRG-type G domain-containing protein n=2 Tax=Alligator mississippiensis TaxID=8496 RepID=A0A151NR03_ALLMI|nr:hypothetical protein Y1Q_0022071 [Alligator mississippiensis]